MSESISILPPTYFGLAITTRDALVLFTQSIKGNIAMINRRPHDRERQNSIRSGNIFIYREDKASIKRWTDGVQWSPSRIMGNYLIYRELNKGFPPGEKKRAAKRKREEDFAGPEPYPQQSQLGSMERSVRWPSYHQYNDITREQERMFLGSLVESYDFKPEGLIKKTITVKYENSVYHMVSYYSIKDAIAGRLSSPETDFPGTVIPQELIQNQTFRVPVGLDGHDQSSRNNSPPPSPSGTPQKPLIQSCKMNYHSPTNSDDGTDSTQYRTLQMIPPSSSQAYSQAPPPTPSQVYSQAPPSQAYNQMIGGQDAYGASYSTSTIAMYNNTTMAHPRTTPGSSSQYALPSHEYSHHQALTAGNHSPAIEMSQQPRTEYNAEHHYQRSLHPPYAASITPRPLSLSGSLGHQPFHHHHRMSSLPTPAIRHPYPAASQAERIDQNSDGENRHHIHILPSVVDNITYGNSEGFSHHATKSPHIGWQGQ